MAQLYSIWINSSSSGVQWHTARFQVWTGRFARSDIEASFTLMGWSSQNQATEKRREKQTTTQSISEKKNSENSSM